MKTATQLKPICFMIMPYGTKLTGAGKGKGPPKVDFDALWSKALRPLLEDDLGFEAVRADQDLGPLIIKEMIERLALSDFVIADVTAPNANVYYEIGIRHAANRAGCVLIGAEWAQPLFDLSQVRQLRYPLPEGKIAEKTASAIRDALRDKIEPLVNGPSLVYETLPGYPSKVDAARLSAFRKRVSEVSAVIAQIGAARAAPKNERRSSALAVRDRYRQTAANVPGVALEILYLLRDAGAWGEVIELVDGLPKATREVGVVREQYYLAKSKTGNHLEAIGALQDLIDTVGDSSERRGLLGGRYKKLADASTDADDRARYLDKAIEEYDRGMRLDLNDYYPSSNLPRLLRQRGADGDEHRAQVAATVTLLACERARSLDPSDPWIRPTLLGAAFDAGDVEAVGRLVNEIRKEGAGAFQLTTTIADLERALKLRKNDNVTAQLQTHLDAMRGMVPATV
jgi:hypothetical protein